MDHSEALYFSLQFWKCGLTVACLQFTPLMILTYPSNKLEVLAETDFAFDWQWKLKRGPR